MNRRRLIAVIRKEFLHVLRDWRSLYLAIAIPVILILLFGYALTMDLKNVPTWVWDQSRTPESRDFLSLLRGSPYFSVDRECDRYRTIETALNQGAAVLAVVIPPDFPAGVHGERPVTIQVLADGSDANTARLALGYLSSLVLIFSGKAAAVQYAQMGKGILVPPVKMLPRAWFNPDLRSQNNIIPGILAIVMVVIAAMLTSVTVAREWETGTMEQLISTPIRVPELVFGKVAPYFIIGLLDVAIAVAMGQWLFHVPLRGNPALLFLMASIFLTGALFFGLLLSIVLKSQVLANQIALVASYMPTLILSGFVFAISSMPTPLQWLTYIIPARYFIAILRGIYLKGIGLEILWLNALLLTIYAAAMIFMANKCLQLKLE